MREMETRPTLADGDPSTGQQTAYALLLNWQSGVPMQINARYRLDRLLGRGGFGLVFCAWDELENKTVALKFIHPGQTLGDRRHRRIEREFEVTRALQHPGLVRLHALEIWKEIYFLVMDFIPGLTLSDWIRDLGPRPWSEVEALAGQLIAVLACLHRAGIVHRDIKPSNLILTPKGRLILLDLGLTRDLTDTQKTASTGELVGSPHYLPPELILGHDCKPAADIYQVGLVLHFLLSGRHPYAEEEQNTARVLGHQLSTTLHLPKTITLPGRARMAIQRCLEKEPSRRPRDADELSRLLNERFSLARLRRRLQIREPLKKGLLSLLALVALLTGGLYLTLPPDTIVEKDQALIARNALGREFWRKDPQPGSRLAGWISGQDEQHRLAVSAVYTPPYPYHFTLDTVKPTDFSSVQHFWDSRGLDRHPPQNESVFKVMEYFDFFPSARLKRVDKEDLDGDGQKELSLFWSHSGNMFPNLLAVWSLDPQHRLMLFSPGDFTFSPKSKTHRGLNLRQPEQSGLLVLSNPFCHYHLWVWNLSNDPLNNINSIPPNFDSAKAYTLKVTDLVFLPSHTVLTRDTWAEAGRVEFSCQESQLTLTVERSGLVTVGGREQRSFQEALSVNAAAISLLNRVYHHVVRREAALARQTTSQIITRGMKNPWLRSLIAYYRAEAALLDGQPHEARKRLQEALTEDPFNTDASNRLCELEVLQKGPRAGLEISQKNSRYTSNFWGLGVYGQALFQLCCHVMTDKPFTREQIPLLALEGLSTPSLAQFFYTNFQTLCALYSSQGSDRDLARADLLAPRNSHDILPFDISELQLILARLWMVNGEWHKAEPLLRFYATETILHRPYADLSLAWCEAEAGRFAAASERAQEAFTRIRRMAESQFWARFWLFYDAYAYGRTMERTGHPERAVRGYRLCIELAPHSLLARDAATRLSPKP
jgi:serine/threonine protein kinase/tetratricopeptide (TPR) repeat protein